MADCNHGGPGGGLPHDCRSADCRAVVLAPFGVCTGYQHSFGEAQLIRRHPFHVPHAGSYGRVIRRVASAGLVGGNCFSDWPNDRVMAAPATTTFSCDTEQGADDGTVLCRGASRPWPV